jgi:hypothetical protein
MLNAFELLTLNCGPCRSGSRVWSTAGWAFLRPMGTVNSAMAMALMWQRGC